MTENVVYVRGSRAGVRRAIRRAVELASGRAGQTEVADAMQTRIGMAALGFIRHAFVVKSRGGTDAAGLSWPPLKKSTIAYSRRHPGVPPAAQRAGNRPSWMLTEKQRARWWEIYSRALARFKGNKARAAQIAWAMLKGSGAETLIGTYGNTQVDILRDIGLLLNSLSPGVGAANQVFRVGAGEVIVGTNRKGAKAHQEGIPGRLPQRRLWAEPSQWPEEWWGDITTEARQGFIDVLLYALHNQ